MALINVMPLNKTEMKMFVHSQDGQNFYVLLNLVALLTNI